MDFSEIVGFLITILAIIYIFVKRAQDTRKRSQTHEDESYEGHHQEEKLKDFLKSLEIDMEDSEDFTPPPAPKAPIPKPLPVHREAPKPKPVHKRNPLQEEFKFRSDMDDFQLKTNIEGRKYKVNIKNKYEEGYGEHLLSPEFRGEKIIHLMGYKRSSRIKKLIRSLPSKKDMVLLHEVLDKPKGFKF